MQFTSAKLGWIRQIAARVDRSGRLGCCRLLSATLGCCRLHSATLGCRRLHWATLGCCRLHSAVAGSTGPHSAVVGSTRLLSAAVGHTRLLSAPLGHTRLLSAPLGHTRLLSAPLGCCRLHSATLGCCRLHSATLGSSALPDSAPRCNGGRWQGPAPRPEPREGTERWDSRLSPAHPVPARPRVPRSAPCSAERGLWARSGDNALGSAAAPGGSRRCPQGRKNHPTPPTFARSFGVGAAKGKRLQQQGSALEGSGPAHAVGEPGLAQGMVQVLLWHQSCCPLEPCSRCDHRTLWGLFSALWVSELLSPARCQPWDICSASRLSLLEQPGPCRAQALRHRGSPVPRGLWHLVRKVAAAPGAGWRSKPPSRARLQRRPELCLEQGVLRAASACAAPA
uniref:uncharacterized protein LOC129121249 n=1 Tax=Agelaius phoeniceus TaxID=39638 RepID=UPI0023EBD2FB|nr:uncharacterized protein LOC129121249 [Agelaius phoeniceus]